MAVRPCRTPEGASLVKDPITVTSVVITRTTREMVTITPVRVSGGGEDTNRHEQCTQQRVSVRKQIIADIDPEADLRYRSSDWPETFTDARAERIQVVLEDAEPPQVRLEARSLLRNPRQGQRGALRPFKLTPSVLSELRQSERCAWLPEFVDSCEAYRETGETHDPA